MVGLPELSMGFLVKSLHELVVALSLWKTTEIKFCWKLHSTCPWKKWWGNTTR